ncbi:hypothetical protein ACKFKF_29710 [Phormidesmis sp. 146-12]
MATLNTEILDAANADGLLPKRLTANQKLYLHKSVLTANQIYWAISESDGLDVEQLKKILDLNENTVKQFTRWLMAKKAIYNEEYGMEGRNVFFTSRHHTNLKKK